jgi:hypothetical protein
VNDGVNADDDLNDLNDYHTQDNHQTQNDDLNDCQIDGLIQTLPLKYFDVADMLVIKIKNKDNVYFNKCSKFPLSHKNIPFFLSIFFS